MTASSRTLLAAGGGTLMSRCVGVADGFRDRGADSGTTRNPFVGGVALADALPATALIAALHGVYHPAVGEEVGEKLDANHRVLAGTANVVTEVELKHLDGEPTRGVEKSLRHGIVRPYVLHRKNLCKCICHSASLCGKVVFLELPCH